MSEYQYYEWQTVDRILTAEEPPEPYGDTWQRRLNTGTDQAQTRGVFAEPWRHGMRVLNPGDAEWPGGMDALGYRAPVAMWTKGNAVLLAG